MRAEHSAEKTFFRKISFFVYLTPGFGGIFRLERKNGQQRKMNNA
jgi:hypothetical protein